MSLRRLACVLSLIVTSAFFAPNIFAENISRVVIKKENGSVVVDYSGLNAEIRGEVAFVRLTKCDQAPEGNDCSSSNAASLLPAMGNTVSIDQIGLFKVELLAPVSRTGGATFPQVVIWNQFVPNLYNPNDALRRAIASHAPVYSFSQLPEYFPVSVENLFNRQRSDYSFKAVGGLLNQSFIDRRKEYNDSTSTIGEYMATNGHAESRLLLDKDIATTIRGSAENFPVYWMADRLSEDSVRVLYFALFAFDEKHPEYIDTPFGSSLGDHELDRESVAITFQKRDNGEWLPIDVSYAGHVANQPTSFLGCVDFPNCSDARPMAIANWNGGGTVVSWDVSSRLDNRPIVYVAHGSHAHAPAWGYYGVNVPGATPDVSGEPAGALLQNGESFSEPRRLIELDFNDSSVAALAFSGQLIRSGRGFGGWFRVFPFVRYPTSTWVSTLGRNFENCVRARQGCENYVKLADDGVSTDPNQSQDTDGDGVADSNDDFPFDSQFSKDSDNDGVPDERDAFPLDPAETADLNGDGLGDNANLVLGLTRIYGKVTDDLGQPISKALLRIELFQSAFARDGIVQTRSGPDGTFSFSVDLDILPETFAMTAAAPGHVPENVFFAKRLLMLDLLEIERDFTMSLANSTTVVIEPEPVLHHLGDNEFEGAANSQFQRASQGVGYQRVFALTPSQMESDTFELSIVFKGVDPVDSAIQFNNGEILPIPATDSAGGFSIVTFTDTVARLLQVGNNTLSIASGYLAATDDYDDFEFVNPILRLVK